MNPTFCWVKLSRMKMRERFSDRKYISSNTSSPEFICGLSVVTCEAKGHTRLSLFEFEAREIKHVIRKRPSREPLRQLIEILASYYASNPYQKNN